MQRTLVVFYPVMLMAFQEYISCFKSPKGNLPETLNEDLKS